MNAGQRAGAHEQELHMPLHKVARLAEPQS